jgi:hypothetical protein
MTESQRLWEAWVDALERVIAALPDKIDVACPSHGDGTVQLLYTGDPEDRIGYATVWCDTCHEGIASGRAKVPPGVEMVPFGASREERAARIPPDVRLLPPDPAPGDDDEEDVL